MNEFGRLVPAIEQLVAIEDTGSVTAAAAELGIPQPTVSRTVSRLAKELGTDLLMRQGRGVRLTRQGLLLAEHGRRALAEIDAGLSAVRADLDAEGGRVVLGFLHSMGPRAVPELLRGFRALHPSVSIGLVQDAAETVLDGVLAGTVDLALASPVPDRPELRARALARQRLVALVPAGHRLAGRTRISVSELAGEQLVTMRVGFGVRTLTDELLRAAGLPLAYAFESDELTTIAGLVGAGLGVSVLPGTTTTDPDVVQLPLRDAGASRTISLAWSSRRTLTVPVQALRRHLLAEAPAALAAG